MNLDIVYKIALSSDYDTAIVLIKLYPQLETTYSLWKNKYLQDFGDNFFKEWSWKENYLVRSRKYFYLLLNLSWITDSRGETIL